MEGGECVKWLGGRVGVEARVHRCHGNCDWTDGCGRQEWRNERCGQNQETPSSWDGPRKSSGYHGWYRSGRERGKGGNIKRRTQVGQVGGGGRGTVERGGGRGMGVEGGKGSGRDTYSGE